MRGQAVTCASERSGCGAAGPECVPVVSRGGGARSGGRVVVFGGGTGVASLLRGLKHHSDRVTAVITVGDDGGSSGRLRKDLQIQPPGDIRNCLAALADDDAMWARLFQYRFEESDLKGHALGNAILAALTRVTGDFASAVREAGRLLGIRGQVIPCTPERVALVARHRDGTKSTGEVQISKSGKAIVEVSLKPRPGPVSKELASAIAEADLFVLGPGSLFTSVVPNLLIDGVVDGIRARAAQGVSVVYVANIMTQPGETSRLALEDHVEAIEAHGATGLVNLVLVNNGPIPQGLLDRYAARGAFPVERRPVAGHAAVTWRTVERELVSADEFIRHDPERTAAALMEIGAAPGAFGDEGPGPVVGG